MYEEEYINSNNDRNIFIKVMRKKYPHLKISTIIRRWYDVKKNVVKKDNKKVLYEDEYKSANNLKMFINIMINSYPHLKISTIDRRWYDLKKRFGLKIEEVKLKVKEDEVKIKDKPIPKYLFNEKEEPSMLKHILFNDMKKFNIKPTRKYLRKYGFNEREINWLEDEGEIFEQDTKAKRERETQLDKNIEDEAEEYYT